MFKTLKTFLDNGANINIALSNFCHYLKYSTDEEFTNVISEDATALINDFSDELKVSLAATIEWYCDNRNIEKPMWIYKPGYYFLKETFPAKIYKNHMEYLIPTLKKYSPVQFSRRNLFVSEDACDCC